MKTTKMTAALLTQLRIKTQIRAGSSNKEQKNK